MDPSRSKSNGGHDSERKFVLQILWLSLAGGMASFTRVSSRFHEVCPALVVVSASVGAVKKVVKLFLTSLLGMECFSADLADESSSRFDRCPTSERSL